MSSRSTRLRFMDGAQVSTMGSEEGLHAGDAYHAESRSSSLSRFEQNRSSSHSFLLVDDRRFGAKALRLRCKNGYGLSVGATFLRMVGN
jgi:hypothetical protein